MQKAETKVVCCEHCKGKGVIFIPVPIIVEWTDEMFMSKNF